MAPVYLSSPRVCYRGRKKNPRVQKEKESKSVKEGKKAGGSGEILNFVNF